jgi:hypothetical protein
LYISSRGRFCQKCAIALSVDIRSETWRAKDLEATASNKRYLARELNIVSAEDDYWADRKRIYPPICSRCSLELEADSCFSATDTLYEGIFCFSCVSDVVVRDRERRKRFKFPSGVTKEQWIATLDHFNHRCAYCGKFWYVVEHAIPVRRGGKNKWNNLLPSCFKCNSQKAQQTLTEWVRRFPNNVRLTAALVWLQQCV